jgi:hypothetical protein
MTDGQLAESFEKSAKAREDDSRYMGDRGIATPALDAEAIALRRAAAALRVKAQLVEALEELANLMDDVREGAYTPDSFTCQPARAALKAAKETP